MPDKKLTDSEIVKALESYIKDIGCAKCNFKDKYLLTVLKSALDLINRLQAEVERLEAEIDKQYEIAEANVRAEIASGGTSCHWCEDKVRAEAYKECIEKANEIIDLIVDLMFDGNVSKCQLPSCHKPSSIPCESEICIQENKEYWHSKLDNLLKELVGDK